MPIGFPDILSNELMTWLGEPLPVSIGDILNSSQAALPFNLSNKFLAAVCLATFFDLPVPMAEIKINLYQNTKEFFFSLSLAIMSLKSFQIITKPDWNSNEGLKFFTKPIEEIYFF